MQQSAGKFDRMEQVLFLKKHKWRLIVAGCYLIGMLLYCYFHLAVFAQNETIGIHVGEEKQWQVLENGAVLQQSFTAEHKQLTRFFIQFQTDEASVPVLVNVQLKNGESVLTEQMMDFSTYTDADQKIWFSADCMLETGKEYTVVLERLDDAEEELRVRADNLAEQSLQNNGMSLVLEYEYINKGLFLLCMVLIAAGCMGILFPFRFQGKTGKLIKGIYFFGMPLILVELFEWICNGTVLTGKWLLFNYLWLLVCYAVIAMICRKLMPAVMISSIVSFLLSCLNYHILLFRERPILPWDIKAFSTALTVAAEFSYQFTLPMLISVLLLVILLSMIASKEMLHSFSETRKGAWALTGAGILVVAAWCLIFYCTNLNDAIGFWTNMWDIRGAYCEQGFFLSTFNNLRYYKADKPEGYTDETALNILTSYEADVTDEMKTIPKNLIVIQSESFTDFSALGNLNTNEDCLTYFHSLNKNVSTGSLQVSCYGGGTSETEWEVLTGNSLVFLPLHIVPYQTYVNQNTSSLAKIMKEQGYRTIAMHPNVKENWNRESAFEDMQFDEFIDIDAYAGKEMVRNYYSDIANTEMIIETYEQNQEEPLFIFNISMQNHGGYQDDYDNTVLIEDSEEELLDAEEFLSLLQLTDESIQMLFEYFENISDPTMIVIYGDHQPSLDLAFYRYLFGKDVEELDDKEALKLYQTPIMIWTNYASESKDLGNMSANYLSAVVLQEAGIPTTAYQNFLLEQYTNYPVLTTKGGFNQVGDYIDSTTLKAAMTEYQMIQYHIMFGKSDNIKGYY